MFALVFIVLAVYLIGKDDPWIYWLMGGICILAIVVAIFQKMEGSQQLSERPRPRIEHPHYEEDTDYECGICGKRFDEPYASCPYCGVSFNCKETDETEYEEEEEEDEEFWDMIEEEEGW